MKIVYLGALSSTDTDFPLIRALQKKGVDITAFFPLLGFMKAGGLLEIDRVKPIDGIIKASEYEAFRKYSDYINLDQIYVINNYHYCRRHWQSWAIYFKFIRFVKKINPDIFHYVWPFRRQSLLLLQMRNPRYVMTVHDPFPHSGLENKWEELYRKMTFLRTNKFVLLNDIQKSDFCKFYHIKERDILVTKIGCFDWLDNLKTSNFSLDAPYILFWGQIQSHKGVDVLLEAMLKVHDHLPWLHCVIAGKGSFYFDINKYNNLDYIKILNRYLSVELIKDLLKECLFAVCPYKDATQSGVVQTAFSAGVPLIVTNVGALPETVKDNEFGIVIPPNDVDALSRAIIKLVSDKDLQRKFRNNIEMEWKMEKSWDNIADDYISLYQSLL